MYRINLRREQITLQVKPGSNLLEVLRKSGVMNNAPCGGNGKCGKCKVKLYGKKEKIVKACEIIVMEDMEMDTLLVETKHQILTHGYSRSVNFEPGLRKLYLQILPCPIGKSISDWSRMVECLQEQLPVKGGYKINIEVASVLSDILKEQEGRIWAVVFQDQILQISAEEPRLYMAAFDIGTTTVAAYLLNGETGEEVCTASKKNPQSQYGADVMNRANYALEYGMQEMTSCIRNTVNELLAELAKKANISHSEIYLMSVVGNTCMHHLFLGISVNSLVHAPYNPAIVEGMILKAGDYGIKLNSGALLLMLPNIAGFVGSDTVACMLASDFTNQKEWTLLIDIGTNGEMVLGKDHQMTTCSTAAGPAFEGAGISCGMCSADGAISNVKWQDGQWRYKTIGDKSARGICGSGLLDLVAELLRIKKMNDTGKLLTGKEIVLVKQEESQDNNTVTLTQRDIRELQLAKAAISAGVHLLAQKMKISIEDIKQVWIAGAFGSFLSPESACRIGLIPPELRDRITALGNAAGQGAKQVLRNQYLWEVAQLQARETDFLELASLSEFQNCFIDKLEFPKYTQN